MGLWFWLQLCRRRARRGRRRATWRVLRGASLEGGRGTGAGVRCVCSGTRKQTPPDRPRDLGDLRGPFNKPGHGTPLPTHSWLLLKPILHADLGPRRTTRSHGRALLPRAASQACTQQARSRGARLWHSPLALGPLAACRASFPVCAHVLRLPVRLRPRCVPAMQRREE